MKTIANTFALLLCLPAIVLYRAGVALLGRTRVFPGWSQAFSLLPGISGVYLRRAFYSRVLPRVGRDVWISFGTVLSHGTAKIEDRVYVGVDCMLGDVTIEADVLIGSHVSIINGNRQHGIDRLDIPVREQPGQYPRVTIGEDTWIGDRAVVLADVGRHCVIGAGAVVTKPVPDYAIAVGCPARVVGDRRDAAKGRETRDKLGEGSVATTTPV
jgi:acetyltransferase-like isoleucine patch superfamily enzyme